MDLFLKGHGDSRYLPWGSGLWALETILDRGGSSDFVLLSGNNDKRRARAVPQTADRSPQVPDQDIGVALFSLFQDAWPCPTKRLIRHHPRFFNPHVVYVE